MNFLFPLYLMGLAAIAIPVILHLRRRPPKERTEFSSLMFLVASPIERKRRRKIENLLLLLLRCALIALLAFLFARPLFRGAAFLEGGGEGSFTVVLLDRSASMQREDLWERGVKAALERAGAVSERDRLALVSFDSKAEVLVGFERWEEEAPPRRRDLFATALEGVAAGWRSTDLGAAIAVGVEMIEEARNSAEGADGEGSGPGRAAQGKILLLSDLQEGADRRALEVIGWPESTELEVEVLAPGALGNASLHLLASEDVITLREKEDEGTAEEEPSDGDEEEGSLRLRVSNGPTSIAGDLEVGWTGVEVPTVAMAVAPGRQRTFRMAVPGGATELRLAGDEHDFDNRVFVAQETPRALRVLWVDEKGEDAKAGDAADPLFYLERVLQATNLHAPIVSREWSKGRALAALADVVIVAGVIAQDQRTELRRFVEGGGTALILIQVKEQGEMLGELIGGGEIGVEEAAIDGEYVLLEEIAFDDPLLGAFADPRLRDFSKIHFWHFRKLEPVGGWPEDSRILARFDSGEAAWVSIRAGAGEFVVFASGWHPADSQLGLSTKFVPLIYSLLEKGGVGGRTGGQFVVGDSLPVGEGSSVRRPDGREDPVAEGGRYSGTDQPGIYEVTGAEGAVVFAVNLDHRESRTEVMALDELEATGVLLAGTEKVVGTEKRDGADATKRKANMLDVEREKRQQLWRWLIIAAIVAVFLEMLIAGRGTQPRTREAV